MTNEMVRMFRCFTGPGGVRRKNSKEPGFKMVVAWMPIATALRRGNGRSVFSVLSQAPRQLSHNCLMNIPAHSVLLQEAH